MHSNLFVLCYARYVCLLINFIKIQIFIYFHPKWEFTNRVQKVNKLYPFLLKHDILNMFYVVKFPNVNVNMSILLLQNIHNQCYINICICRSTNKLTTCVYQYVLVYINVYYVYLFNEE